MKRKLDGAGSRSPLNGDQNGFCDGTLNNKRLRREGNTGPESVLNSAPSMSPLHPADLKPAGTTNHVTGGAEEPLKNGGLKTNGTFDLDDGFGLLKELKQEPLEEAPDTSPSNQNRLFSDINLNEQEWQELIDELANTVPEDDMHDLFNEDFEEKKEPGDNVRTLTEHPQISPPVATAPNNPPTGQSPQVRPASSGPPFATAANGTPPRQPLQQSPAVAMASGSPPSCLARSPQTPAQTQTSRPTNGSAWGPSGSTVLPSGGPGGPGVPGGQGQGGAPGTELSPAEQLKQMAAQQRAKLVQQKQQSASWSPAATPTSPYASPFNSEKPNSPMMYPQSFSSQNSLVPLVPKPAMNSYPLSKPLSYSNTKPLSHFSGLDHMTQRMTPPTAGQAKSTLMPYMQGGPGGGPPPAQGPVPGQTAHLSEDQKRMMMMKQKGLGPFTSMQQHTQVRRRQRFDWGGVSGVGLHGWGE